MERSDRVLGRRGRSRLRGHDKVRGYRNIGLKHETCPKRAIAPSVAGAPGNRQNVDFLEEWLSLGIAYTINSTWDYTELEGPVFDFGLSTPAAASCDNYRHAPLPVKRMTGRRPSIYRLLEMAYLSLPPRQGP
ncbi:MAG: hypothetical protein F6K30_01200 [Cyanothece sp. SIO2G6]|nr:hypothetical protein [Cyanothece sp. SIO2G6]